jgi:hypothetical protein
VDAILGRLCGAGHPGFVAFAAVAPMIPMTVPIRSAVMSRAFGGDRSGSRGGVGAGLSVMFSILAQAGTAHGR